MSTVPQYATYKPYDNTMEVTITEADPATGQIKGTYIHNHTPEGPIKVEGHIGGYAWVNNNDGGIGTAPFSINFTVSVRPDGYPYCIVDFWNGFYSTGNSMLLSGVRSYVKDNGVTQSLVLGTLELFKQETEAS